MWVVVGVVVVGGCNRNRSGRSDFLAEQNNPLGPTTPHCPAAASSPAFEAPTHTMLTPIATTTMEAATGGVKRLWNHTISITATKGMMSSLAIWGGGGGGVVGWGVGWGVANE